MTSEDITKTVTSYIEQSREGLEIENPKCDFKSHWYNLVSKPGINEFLKDTSAIANTFGPDGLIIIGFDTKTNTYINSTFRDSKLSDTAKITDLINRKVDKLFLINIYDIIIEGNNLSVIHIPPSLDKPHVITNYQTFDKNGDLRKEEQQRVFVRKGTSTYPASKNDFELMYYDRKNIIPEYKIITSYHKDSLDITTHGHRNEGKYYFNNLACSIYLTFENAGRRPVAISEIQIRITLFEDPNDYDKIDFASSTLYRSANILIQPNEIKNQKITFECYSYPFEEYSKTLQFIHEIRNNRQHIKAKTVKLILSEGKSIESELIQA